MLVEELPSHLESELFSCAKPSVLEHAADYCEVSDRGVMFHLHLVQSHCLLPDLAPRFREPWACG